jgi:hypothetical protein
MLVNVSNDTDRQYIIGYQFGVAALPSFKGGFVDLAGIASSSFH